MPYKDKDKEREYFIRNRERIKERERLRSKKRIKTAKYKEYQQKYREAHRVKAKKTTHDWVRTDHGRNKTYLNKYGITLEQYNKMLEEQGNVCAICRQPEQMLHKGKPKRLCVDHDHKTGKVRGILCQRCNTTLGRYEDNPELMRNLITYLEDNF